MGWVVLVGWVVLILVCAFVLMLLSLFRDRPAVEQAAGILYTPVMAAVGVWLCVTLAWVLSQTVA